MSLWRDPENTDLGSSGPLEASRGRTEQTIVEIAVCVYGTLRPKRPK